MSGLCHGRDCRCVNRGSRRWSVRFAGAAVRQPEARARCYAPPSFLIPATDRETNARSPCDPQRPHAGASHSRPLHRAGRPGEAETINALLRALDHVDLLRAQEAAAWPQPIETLTPKPDTSYLLFCPDQGGWRVGEWWAIEGGRWIAAIDTESELYPTHWTPAPADLS
jgi:hypothetical protein